MCHTTSTEHSQNSSEVRGSHSKSADMSVCDRVFRRDVGSCPRNRRNCNRNGDRTRNSEVTSKPLSYPFPMHSGWRVRWGLGGWMGVFFVIFYFLLLLVWSTLGRFQLPCWVNLGTRNLSKCDLWGFVCCWYCMCFSTTFTFWEVQWWCYISFFSHRFWLLFLLGSGVDLGVNLGCFGGSKSVILGA